MESQQGEGTRPRTYLRLVAELGTSSSIPVLSSFRDWLSDSLHSVLFFPLHTHEFSLCCESSQTLLSVSPDAFIPQI